MAEKQTLEQLSRSFSDTKLVRFDTGPGGLIRANICGPLATGMIYLYGAHVAEYQPAGEKPVLFMSQAATYEVGKPIRGGIPVIFPWFGPKAGSPDLPMHGLVRLREWKLESVTQMEDGAVQVTLHIADDHDTRELWPMAFALRYRVTFGKTLDVSLEVHNTSSIPLVFEEALHTYFAVSDARRIDIVGLAGVTYLSKVEGVRQAQGQDPIRITGETDRIYFNTRSTCFITDPGHGRRIVVEKSGSDATVVWNPWIAKAKAMPDFGDEEWPGMVCVETVNAGENAVTLGANQRHTMGLRVRTEKMA